ncbi:MAG: hypothetical protein QOF40_243 [Actinomycetota bacterium]|nr:hypothetical protein [Actinomycetota bacterium]
MAGDAEHGTVLVVEELADWSNGHFSVRFAQLAQAYVELGYEVEVLTAVGWHRSGEHPVPFSVHRFGPVARVFRRGARRVLRGDLAPVVLTLITAAAIRAHVRRMVTAPVAIVMLGWQTVPAVVAATAAADDAHWLLNHFQAPRPLLTPGPRRLARGIDTIARRREARRRARGGALRLAVADEPRRDAWAKQVPYLDPVVLPIAGVREVTPEPDARVHLGLDEHARVALLFGDRYSKDRATVLAAFCRLPGWTLVIAGRVAEGLASSANVVIMSGVVSDATRDGLFAAADLVVLSFSADYRSNSGTLMDAISLGVPVVCTEDAAAARIVQRYRLGVGFTGGDVSSLVDAVHRAPGAIAPADLESARTALSNRAVARGQLSAMGISDRATRAPAPPGRRGRPGSRTRGRTA